MFLAVACFLGMAIALIFVIASTSEDASLFSIATLRAVAIPVLLTSFVGALFILPVGLLKTGKSWVMMPSKFSEEVTLLDRIYFPFSALVRPKILADPKTPARAKFLDALKWLGAGTILALIAVTLGEWRA